MLPGGALRNPEALIRYASLVRFLEGQTDQSFG